MSLTKIIGRKGTSKIMKETEKTGKETEKAPGTYRIFVYPLAFFILGILWVTFGFWKTLFVAVLTLIGFFIGSTDNVEDSIKQLVNKVFPPSQKKVTYSAEDMEKLKKAFEKKELEEKEPEKKA